MGRHKKNKNPEETEKTPAVASLAEREFERYFEDLANDDFDFDLKLYRVVRNVKKTKKTYLRKYVNELPDEEQIGEEFGGGQFWLAHNGEDGTLFEKTIHIDEIFTQRLAKRRYGEQAPPQAAQGEPLQYVSKIINDMLVPMLGIMKGNQAPAPQQSNQPDMMANMAVKMIEGMTESLANGLTRIQSSIIDKQLNQIEGGEKPMPAVEESKNPIVREILDLVKEYGPKLLKAKGIKAKVYQELIQEDERVQKVKEEPGLSDIIYTAAVNDPEIGPDKARKLFEKAGFDFEDQPSTNGQASPAGAPNA